ncbi:MAG: excinuclease ABC subunit UvrA, partial [Candidatus Hodarchaeota archaeon]
MRDTISIKGARANNLKNIDVEIPRDNLVVITGVSGSGKTSLAFDVVFGEAQRKFLESMSAYSRSHIPLIDKADVDSILGLSPVVAIGQRRGQRNPRSTVGTMTDISNYLRLLYSTIGQANCPYCKSLIPVKSIAQITERIQALPDETIIEIQAPVFKFYGEDYTYLLDDTRQQGYRRIRINEKLYDTSNKIQLDEFQGYTFAVIVDKFVIKREIHKQLMKAVENALEVGSGFIQFLIFNPDTPESENITKFYDE